MPVFESLDLLGLLDTFIRLLAAFALGAIVGLERQYRQRTAGLRTNVLVAVGAAIFVDIAFTISGPYSAAHVVAYVVTGVGFLGAGVIMRESGNVRGINTAATLWGSAAIGACAGAGLLGEAVLATLFVLAANTFLRPIVNRMNRQPLDVEETEVTNILTVIVDKNHQREALALVEAMLEAADYPTRELEVEPFGEGEVEIIATLAATSADGRELDRISERIGHKPYVRQSYWSASTSE